MPSSALTNHHTHNAKSHAAPPPRRPPTTIAPKWAAATITIWRQPAASPCHLSLPKRESEAFHPGPRPRLSVIPCQRVQQIYQPLPKRSGAIWEISDRNPRPTRLQAIQASCLSARLLRGLTTIHHPSLLAHLFIPPPGRPSETTVPSQATSPDTFQPVRHTEWQAAPSNKVPSGHANIPNPMPLSAQTPERLSPPHPCGYVISQHRRALVANVRPRSVAHNPNHANKSSATLYSYSHSLSQAPGHRSVPLRSAALRLC